MLRHSRAVHVIVVPDPADGLGVITKSLVNAIVSTSGALRLVPVVETYNLPLSRFVRKLPYEYWFVFHLFFIFMDSTPGLKALVRAGEGSLDGPVATVLSDPMLSGVLRTTFPVDTDRSTRPYEATVAAALRSNTHKMQKALVNNILPSDIASLLSSPNNLCLLRHPGLVANMARYLDIVRAEQEARHLPLCHALLRELSQRAALWAQEVGVYWCRIEVPTVLSMSQGATTSRETSLVPSCWTSWRIQFGVDLDAPRAALQGADEAGCQG